MDKTFSDFLDLSLFAVIGALVGIAFGYYADSLGFIGNPYAEGITRLLAGSGDSIGELSYIVWLRLRRRHSAAEIYVLGKLFGMVTGPIFHSLVRISGFNPYGLAGAIYAIAYSNFDNLMGSLAFLISQGKKKFFSQPYQVGNLIAISLIASTSLIVRFIGFSPIQNLASGIEAGLMDTDSLIAGLWAWRAYLMQAKHISPLRQHKPT